MLLYVEINTFPKPKKLALLLVSYPQQSWGTCAIKRPREKPVATLVDILFVEFGGECSCRSVLSKIQEWTTLISSL